MQSTAYETLFFCHPRRRTMYTARAKATKNPQRAQARMKRVEVTGWNFRFWKQFVGDAR